VKIFHYGNTAGNGYHNFRILGEVSDVTSERVLSYSDHCLSSAAWERLDFELPDARFFEKADWSRIDGANELEALAMDRRLLTGELPTTDGAEEKRNQRTKRYRYWKRKAGRTPNHLSQDNCADIHIAYGFPVQQIRNPSQGHFVALEHGTLRWISRGLESDSAMRQDYRRWLSTVDHLWVTNLDDETVALAEEILPDRWTAIPHPYYMDQSAPYDEDEVLRRYLLQQTQSEFLILMPSSINFMPDHDKGTLIALEAFTELRSQGHPVGLICIEWGRQVDDLKEILKFRGLDEYVTWTLPMPRVKLQRFMASVDVVLDQFRLKAFGGIAFKAMEQGAPLISRGVTATASVIIGSVPPYMSAGTADEIVRHVETLLTVTNSFGRDETRLRYGSPLREWFCKYHHHGICREIQLATYRSMIAGNKTDPTPSWSGLVGQFG